MNKIGSEESIKRLAVLIDADNAQPSIIAQLLNEIAKFGEATVKRIYGDFTATNSESWKKMLHKHAIKPIQQFAYTKGKNATDSMLIIDAMDLLYTRKFDGFCLVSSDSDFTGLAIRIKEEGLMVLGFGEEKTPDAFRSACHKFVLTEVLRPKPDEKKAPASANITANALKEKKPKKTKLPTAFLLEALEQSCDDTGWANLGTFGSYINRLKPDFDTRLFGYKKLSDLVRNRKDLFIIDDRSLSNNRTNLYLKAKGKH